ncbi:MAG: HAMP domain-containing protein [Halanaerobiales bacterium]
MKLKSSKVCIFNSLSLKVISIVSLFIIISISILGLVVNIYLVKELSRAIESLNEEMPHSSKSTNNIYYIRNTVIRTIFAGGIMIFVTLVLIIWLLIRQFFIKPIKEINFAAKQAAAGNIKETVNIKRNDEIGIFVEDFNHMIDELRGNIQNIIQAARQVTELALAFDDTSGIVGNVSSTISDSLQQLAFEAGEQANSVELINTEVLSLDNRLKEIKRYILIVEELAGKLEKVTKINQYEFDNPGGQVYEKIRMDLKRLVEGIKTTTNAIDNTNEKSQHIVGDIDTIAGNYQEITASLEEISSSSEVLTGSLQDVIEINDKLSVAAVELERLVKKFKAN